MTVGLVLLARAPFVRVGSVHPRVFGRLFAVPLSPSTPLFLHACCGPCSLEPVRALQDEGYALTLCYVNPNIQPQDEYERRLVTLREWAASMAIEVIAAPYDAKAWEREVAPWGTNRPARCAACYRLRLREAARMASDRGFVRLSTTLAVSPYQLFEVCGHELEMACGEQGLEPVWRDFRPYYPQATTRAKELGLYRQNYCGCRFSAAEAALERTEAREDRRRGRDEERAAGRTMVMMPHNQG